jgi:AcrR family transcriptional regulator
MVERQRNARGSGALLRREVLDSAQRILERTGNEDAVTLRAVAREARISAPSIYSHFASSSDILDALVGETFASLIDILTDARDTWTAPVDRLLAISLAYVRFGDTYPERYLTLFERRRSVATANRYKANGIEYESTPGATAFNLLADVLEAAIHPHPSAETPNAVATEAAIFWSTLHGYVTLKASSPGFPWFLDAEQMCAELVTRLLLTPTENRASIAD